METQTTQDLQKPEEIIIQDKKTDCKIITDLFELMNMSKRVDRALGEGKESKYEPWKSSF